MKKKTSSSPGVPPVFGRPDFSRCGETNAANADPENLSAEFEGRIRVLAARETIPVFASVRLFPGRPGCGAELGFRVAPEDAKRLAPLTGLSPERLSGALSGALSRAVPAGTAKRLAKLARAVTGVRCPFVGFRAVRVQRTAPGKGEFEGTLKILVPGREIESAFCGFWERGEVALYPDAFPKELPLPFGPAGAARLFKREFLAFAARNRMRKFRAMPEVTEGNLRLTLAADRKRSFHETTRSAGS